MSAFEVVARVDLEHEYFDHAACPGLIFQPSADCARLMRREGLLLRMRPSALLVLRDVSLPEPDPVRLQFTADARSNVLWWCTRLGRDALAEAGRTGPPLHFDSRGAESQDDGRLRLREVDATEMRAAEAERESAAEAVLATGDGTPDRIERDRRLRAVAADAEARARALATRQRPLLALSIDVPATAAAPVHYVLGLAARRVRWKYLLVPDDASRFVRDKHARITFERRGEQLADGRSAGTFLSDVELPLRERGDEQFQLCSGRADREPTDPEGRVLVAQLPLADAERLGTTLVDGQSVPVAEVYLNVLND